jgi:hypothetical protein
MVSLQIHLQGQSELAIVLLAPLNKHRFVLAGSNDSQQLRILSGCGQP